jgi:hypothetical protein
MNEKNNFKLYLIIALFILLTHVSISLSLANDIYSINIFNVDDYASLYVNGDLVSITKNGYNGTHITNWVKTPFKGASGTFDITSFLKPGSNTLRVVLFNNNSCVGCNSNMDISYSLYKNGIIISSDSFHDYSLDVGVVYNKKIDLFNSNNNNVDVCKIKEKYSVKVSNIKDFASLDINGKLVSISRLFCAGNNLLNWRILGGPTGTKIPGDSGTFDISPYLNPGANKLRFVLWKGSGDQSTSILINVFKDNISVYNDSYQYDYPLGHPDRNADKITYDKTITIPASPLPSITGFLPMLLEE